MRDYDNMPVLDWHSDKAPQKAKAQILHEEPVVLQMPDNFNASLDGEAFGCQLKEGTGILYNCKGEKALHQLAEQNKLAPLDVVAEACRVTSSQVDIDREHNRLIVHD